MKFEWIRDWDEIWSDAFISQWNEWLERSKNAHVFFHPDMAKAWVETYRPLRNLQPLFCIARSGETTIFLPLLIWEKNWKNAFIRTIVPVGYSDFDYHSPIVAGKVNKVNITLFWENLLQELFIKWSHFYDRIDITGIQDKCIGQNNGWKEVDKSPKVDLSKYDSYETFLGTLKSKVRGDVKRKQRRMEELGDFKYRVYQPEEVNQALNTLPAMLHHHSLKWPNAYKAPGYHANLIKQLLPKGLMHLSEISLDGKPICWNLSFVYKKTYYFYMPTYVSDYHRYSPGKVNMFLSMSDVFNRNFDTFDLLRGAEEYKSKLPTVITDIYDLTVVNSHPLSKIKNRLVHLKKMVN